tara:strand:- start:782 stop:1090 length:309 start_codon:yes stop_codon:yes gene_type:complete
MKKGKQMIDKIKNNLTALIATVGLIGTIGTGFVKYGEIMNKIESVEPTKIEGAFKEQNKTIAEQNSTIEKQLTLIRINEKEIELLKAQIKELKIRASNPLAN